MLFSLNRVQNEVTEGSETTTLKSPIIRKCSYLSLKASNCFWSCHRWFSIKDLLGFYVQRSNRSFAQAQLKDNDQPYLNINIMNEIYKEMFLENVEPRENIARGYKKKLYFLLVFSSWISFFTCPFCFKQILIMRKRKSLQPQLFLVNVEFYA